MMAGKRRVAHIAVEETRVVKSTSRRDVIVCRSGSFGQGPRAGDEISPDTAHDDADLLWGSR